MSERAALEIIADNGAALTSTAQQIECMRVEIQTSVLDTMIVANRKFIDHQLKQSDFLVANEIACVLKEGLLLTNQIVTQLRQSAPAQAK